jgi:hypothetical protein
LNTNQRQLFDKNMFQKPKFFHTTNPLEILINGDS